MKRSMFVLASMVYCVPAYAEKLGSPIPPGQAVSSGKPVALSNNDKKSVGCIGVDKASTEAKRPVLRFPCVLPISNHKNNQYWFLKPTKVGNENESYFRIVNWKSDKCLGVNGGSPEPDTILLQFDCDNRANQKWRWTTVRRGNRTALSIQNYDRLCIGVHKRAVGGQGDLANGQELVQEPCSATPDQDWRPIPFKG